MQRESVGLLVLLALLEPVQSKGCSSFFCMKTSVDGTYNGPDPGEPLFLTPYIEEGKIDEARRLSLVGPLPGPYMKSYSGYLTVNKTYNSNLFFWFFPAQEKHETAPVVLWLQGGPGATTLFGLFMEHGPYVIQPNNTLLLREYPWTSRYSMLYVDNPVGTGYSFTDDNKGLAQNQDDVGRDLYSALTQFFQIFSEFQANDFYVAGESYGGKYVPAIGYYIHQNNPSATVKINFKGISIGNGLSDPELIVGGYGDFLYQMGLLDELQREHVQNQTDIIVSLIQQEEWLKALWVFDTLLTGNLKTSFYKEATGCDNYYNILKCPPLQYADYLAKFVTDVLLRRSIHVGSTTFSYGYEVERYLLQDVMKSIKPWLGVLMDNYRVLIYNGQLDVIVAPPLTERFLPTVNWTGAEQYKQAERFPWRVKPDDTEVAGYVRQVGEFFQVIVRGGGHILPADQPHRAFDMMDRFLSKKGFSN